MNVDENGWATGAITPLRPDEAWLLLSPEAEGRVDAERWAHQARTFFRARLAVVQEKRYPSGALPLADALEVDLAASPEGRSSRVLVVTLPLDRAPEAHRAARDATAAIGGAGFDVLIARARRLWQVRGRCDGDPRAPLAVAAVLASTLLAPIVPPEGGAIFGVKGARERLAAAGWST